jgi:hypothetical protein
MRWRYGDTSPVVLAVDSGTVIEIGDLVYLDTDDAKPASAQADQSSEAANQVLFASKFIGVAMQQSQSGDTTPIRVATTGVFEFDIAATTFEVGALIGSKEASNGTQLENQVVAKVSTTDKSLGRCVKRTVTNLSKVLVDIVSTVVKGGAMPPT